MEGLDPIRLVRDLATPVVSVADMPPARTRASYGNGDSQFSIASSLWGGDKFPGGFGETRRYIPNYWTLRQRSDQLFQENLFARGLIRRLSRSVVNTGLVFESEPIWSMLSLTEETAHEWSEVFEERFWIWSRNPALCDYEGRRTFSQLQAHLYSEAKTSGDMLVRLHVSSKTGLPMIHLIRGDRVLTPIKEKARSGNRITHGVERDVRGRQVAYWVRRSSDPWGTVLEGQIEKSFEMMRVPAFGEKTGRRMSWLVYGTDHRQDEVRGQSLLAIILQSLKELDRYRDSEQRAATVNSILAMFIQKDAELMGSRPTSGGAVRRSVVAGTGDEGEPREYSLAGQIPGMVFEELQKGETPVSFDAKRPNINYAAFEQAVVSAIAWACEVPPEILQLAFNSNYSASKAALDQFRGFVTAERQNMGSDFGSPVVTEWLTADVLAGNTQAPGFLEAKRSGDWVVFGAWVNGDWSGPVKPSIEMNKDVKAYLEAVEGKLISRDRASKELFGIRFSKVVDRLKKEQEMLEEAGLAMSEDEIREEVAAAAVPPPLDKKQEAAVLELIQGELEDAADVA